MDKSCKNYGFLASRYFDFNIFPEYGDVKSDDIIRKVSDLSYDLWGEIQESYKVYLDFSKKVLLLLGFGIADEIKEKIEILEEQEQRNKPIDKQFLGTIPKLYAYAPFVNEDIEYMWDDLERFGTEFKILSEKKPAHQEEAIELELEVNQKIIDHSDILYVFYTPDKEDIALNHGIEIATKQEKIIYYIPYDTLELSKIR